MIARHEHPSAWTVAELQADRSWVRRFSSDEVAELEEALAHARRTGRDLLALRPDDFPLPRLSSTLADVRRELEDGRGLVHLRGLPTVGKSLADAATLYWGVGMHIGTAVAQNPAGAIIGDIRDVGDYSHRPPAYQTHFKLDFHYDSTDVVALLCVHAARVGGMTRIVSSTAIHNALLATRPDLVEVLYQPFYLDRRPVPPPGHPPYFQTPFVVKHGGRFFCRYNRRYVEVAQDYPGVPKLTDAQREAIEAVDRLCNDPSLCLEMSFEAGDVQLLCNHVMLHARTEFEDWPEPERRRHLLRLWLKTPAFADLPREFAEREADLARWEKNATVPRF